MDYNKLLEKARKMYAESVTGAEKRRLESIFPELAESEDERIRKALIRALKNLDKDHYNMIYLDGFSIQQCLTWLEKQGEQKHAPKYNIGDTIYFNSFGKVKSMIVANIVDDGDNNPMYEDADGSSIFENDIIKKNPAWSEEDERMIRRIKQSLSCYKDKVCGCSLYDDVEAEINWLKSLKPQPQWKPTDEQMKAFGNAIEFLKDNDYSVHELIILFNDLQFMRV